MSDEDWSSKARLGDILAPDGEWSTERAKRRLSTEQFQHENYSWARAVVRYFAEKHGVSAQDAARELDAGKTALSLLARKMLCYGYGPIDTKLQDFLTVELRYRSGLRGRALYEAAKKDLEVEGRHVDIDSLKTMYHRTKNELRGSLVGSFILDEK